MLETQNNKTYTSFCDKVLLDKQLEHKIELLVAQVTDKRNLLLLKQPLHVVLHLVVKAGIQIIEKVHRPFHDQTTLLIVLDRRNQ